MRSSISGVAHCLSLFALVALERSFDGPVIITSTQGGGNIEDIAAESPDAIIRHPIDILTGLERKDALKIAAQLGFHNETLEEVRRLVPVAPIVIVLLPGGRYHHETVPLICHERHRSPRNQPIN